MSKSKQRQASTSSCRDSDANEPAPAKNGLADDDAMSRAAAQIRLLQILCDAIVRDLTG